MADFRLTTVARPSGLPEAAAFLALLGGVTLVWAAAALALRAAPVGPVTAHMAQHILLMNLAAPIVALALARSGVLAHGPKWTRALSPATVLHLAALWGWHAPPAIEAAHGGGVAAVLAGGSLFAAALWFWSAALAQTGGRRWRAILALLITGKLFCLLAVLLVFAPQALYPALAAAHDHAAAGRLADQQLAGLIMLAVCPVTYVAAGVASAAAWLRALEKSG